MSITLAQAKEHLEYEDTDRNDYIQALIDAAQGWIEKFTGISLTEGTQTKTFIDFGDYLQLAGPVESLTSIAYTDENGDAQTVSDPRLRVDRVYPPIAGWPAILDYSTITVTYEGGLDATVDAKTLDQLHQAQRLLVGHWFEHREAVQSGTGGTVNEVPFAVEALCGPYRTPTLA